MCARAFVCVCVCVRACVCASGCAFFLAVDDLAICVKFLGKIGLTVLVLVAPVLHSKASTNEQFAEGTGIQHGHGCRGLPAMALLCADVRRHLCPVWGVPAPRQEAA